MKKCYISGKITGTTDYEERFAAAAKEVIQLGMIPVNPVTLLHNHDKSWCSYMRESLSAQLQCEAIYFLKDFNQSGGAEIERYLALKLKFDVYYQQYFKLHLDFAK